MSTRMRGMVFEDINIVINQEDQSVRRRRNGKSV